MSIELIDRVKHLIEEIKNSKPATREELEAFRLRFLGAKNELKPLMGEIRNIPDELKKQFGQFVNEAKLAAEAVFEAVKEKVEQAADEAAIQQIDLTAPGEPLPLGSRHPIATTMNRIVEIFSRIPFAGLS